MKTIMSIDPGSKGYVTVRNESGIDFYPLSEYADLHDLADLFYSISATNPDIICAIEEVHALFGSSAKSTFNFGYNVGTLHALLCAAKIPYHLVQPKQWQSVLLSNADKEYVSSKDGKKKLDTKKSTYNAMRRIFPHIDLRKNEKCKGFDDNKCDSLAINEYARRANL